MNNKFLKMAFAGLVMGVSSFANAGLITTMDFETGYDPSFDIAGLYGRTAASGNYGYGVLKAETGSNYVGFTFGAAGSEVLFTSNTEMFNLLELSMIGVWGTQTASLRGYTNNILTHSLLVSLDRFTVDKLSLNWNNINAFGFVVGNDYVNQPGHDCCGGSTSRQIAFDNIVIERGVDVPEPSTLAIFALGLMGLASRRFMKKS